MRASVKMTTRGGLFTPAAALYARNAAERSAGTLAKEAERRIQLRLSSVLRNPTGYYQSQIRVRQDGADAAVTDSGVIYGPWLEGVSSRNARSRFKGYATFRRIQQDVTAAAERIVKPDVDRLVRDLD